MTLVWLALAYLALLCALSIYSGIKAQEGETWTARIDTWVDILGNWAQLKPNPEHEGETEGHALFHLVVFLFGMGIMPVVLIAGYSLRLSIMEEYFVVSNAVDSLWDPTLAGIHFEITVPKLISAGMVMVEVIGTLFLTMLGKKIAQQRALGKKAIGGYVLKGLFILVLVAAILMEAIFGWQRGLLEVEDASEGRLMVVGMMVASVLIPLVTIGLSLLWKWTLEHSGPVVVCWGKKILAVIVFIVLFLPATIITNAFEKAFGAYSLAIREQQQLQQQQEMDARDGAQNEREESQNGRDRKLDVKDRTLQRRDQLLDNRAADLDAREEAIEPTEKQQSEREAKLNKWSGELDVRAGRLQERERSVSQREEVLGRRESAVEGRERTVNERSAALDIRAHELDGQAAGLAAAREMLEARLTDESVKA